VALPRR